MGPLGPEIAHVSPDATGQGGIAAVLRGVAESPLAQRYRLRFITTYRHGDGRTRRLTRFAGALAALAAFCLGRGPRLVHLHAGTRGSWYRKCTALSMVRLLRRPVVIQVHSGPGDIEETWAEFGPLRRRALAGAFARADRVLAVSRASAAALRGVLGLDDVLVVPNAAPLPPARRRPPDGGSPGPARVVYLGGFENPGKGYETLFEALPAILAADGGCEVVLAGPGEPPAGAGALPPDRVRSLGWLGEERKGELLGDPRAIFVLPSTSEGLPMALLEAMAHGTAIVATTVGGIPDTLTDRVDARLVAPGQAGPLAEAIVELAASPAERRRLGEAARERVERLDRDEVFERLAALYDTLLGRTVGGEE